MHPKPAFRKTPSALNLDFSRARGFGVLCVNGAGGPVLAQVPFILSAYGTWADLHLAWSNPLIAAGPGPAVLAVTGMRGGQIWRHGRRNSRCERR